MVGYDKNIPNKPKYIGKILRVRLLESFYYIGRCINETEDSIEIIDKKGLNVLINLNNILSLEVLS